jgi:molybdopterin converting factor small subunit
MSKVTIAIPTPLRTYTENKKKVEIEGETIANALQNLIDLYPKLKNHLYEGGELRNFVNVYLNDEDIRYLDLRKETRVHSGDTIAIIPAIAGGI